MGAGLRIKVLLPLVLMSLILLTYLYGYWMPRSLDNIENEHRMSVERHIDSVAEAMIPLLLAHQLDTIYENLDVLAKKNTDWISIELVDAGGRTMYPLRTSSPPFQGRSGRHVHSIERQIDYLDMHLGKLIVGVDFDPKLLVTRKRQRELATALLIMIIGYVVITGFVVDRLARRPINLLAHASKKLASGDFSAMLPEMGNDEVGTLVNSFRSMRDALRNYQAELRVASSYNRSLIEASLDPLVTIDAGGKITDVNAATEKVSGYGREELIGTDFSDYFTEPEKARGGYQQVFRENSVRDYPLEIKGRDGHITPVLYNASVFRDEQGKVVGVFAAARDITERKLAEAEREQYFKLFQSSSDLMVIADPEGAFLKVNPACTDTLGYTESDLLAKPFMDFIHPDDKQSTIDEMARQLQRGFSLNFENRYICKDRSLRWLSWRASYNKAEGLTYATARDITEQKKAETILRESEIRLKEAQRIAHLGHWELDLLRNTLYWSDEVYRIFGLEPQEFGATYEAFLERVHPDDRDFVNRAYTESVKKRTGYDIEHRIVLKSGELKYVNERCSTEYDEKGSPLRSLGTVLDITGPKQAEDEILKLNAELEQRVAARTADLQKKSCELEGANEKLKELDQLKSMFIASMSHELRTPLNSIIGFSSILLDEWIGPLNDEQKENMSAVLRSGRHLLALINDVIDVSKIEAGRIDVVTEDFDLHDLVTEAVALFGKEVDEKRLYLKVEAVHQVMHSDRRRLFQCIVNLISNAVKFTEKGEISVTAVLKRSKDTEPAPDLAEVTVSDTGIGIREEDMQRLFLPFVRIPSPLSLKVKGTGLGLYLVKKISTEILKGEISAHSSYGEGSSFCIRIPLTLREGTEDEKSSRGRG